jgi:CBS domain-containing protein
VSELGSSSSTYVDGNSALNGGGGAGDRISPDTPRPEPEHADATSASSRDPKTRLSDIARALNGNEPVQPITVRAFLSWFWGSQRRGSFIVWFIRERLRESGLKTVPDFESTYLDAEITFALADEPDSAAGTTPDVAPAAVPLGKDAKGSAPTFADPTYRISKLAPANHLPVYVKPDSTLVEATTLMMANDFSQLPVMLNDREVKGTVSWVSIGSRRALGQSSEYVREAMDPHVEISSDASLFTAIPIIVEHGYTLVRAPDRRIAGMITTSDLSLQFQQLSEPFLLLGEIENHIRRIIDKKFNGLDLEAVKDPSDGTRTVESAADLTLGEYKRLLEDPKRWSVLCLGLDRGVFIQLLEKVRETRNDVMHFDPDGIEDQALAVLRDFAKFLRMLQTVGAT